MTLSGLWMDLIYAFFLTFLLVGLPLTALIIALNLMFGDKDE